MNTVLEAEKPFTILYVAADADATLALADRFGATVHVMVEPDSGRAWARLRGDDVPDLLLLDEAVATRVFLTRQPWLRAGSPCPVIVVAPVVTDELRRLAARYDVLDVLIKQDLSERVVSRINYLMRWKRYARTSTGNVPMGRIPLGKRLFDIGVSASVLLVLSPLLLLVMGLVRLESRGPVIYRSRRVGGGMKVFTMYKFRTMVTGADQLINRMGDHNAYGKAPAAPVLRHCLDCLRTNRDCASPLLLDNEQWCEKEYLAHRQQKAVFNKFVADPRVTRVGKLLRDSSLDELPQFINILRGDMSLVGNRPLPLYEAERLTTGEHIQRFAAPAGLTGLWQVTKRGRADALTDAERIALDIQYAREVSLGTDLRILFKTLRAVWQKETM